MCRRQPLSSARSPSPVRLRRHRPGLHRQRRHRPRSARRRPRHGATSAFVGLINRPRARLRQAHPGARAYHRSSIGLPLRRPIGPQRRRLWSTLPASNAPSWRLRRRWPPVAAPTRACSYAAPRAWRRCTRSPSSSPRARHSQLLPRHLPWRGSPTSAHGLRHAAGFSPSPTSSTAAASPQVACTASSSRRRSHRLPLRQSRCPG